jgi:hypothetical protein
LTDEDLNPEEVASSQDFELDSQCIDNGIVRKIGINGDINAIVVDVNKVLISTTIYLEDFSNKTIKPLKRDLLQLLKDNRNKQAIINSIVNCILSNIPFYIITIWVLITQP